MFYVIAAAHVVVREAVGLFCFNSAKLSDNSVKKSSKVLACQSTDTLSVMEWFSLQSMVRFSISVCSGSSVA